MLYSFFAPALKKKENESLGRGVTLYILIFKGLWRRAKKNTPPDKPGTHYRL
jgi:hypothetical protein